MSRLKNFTPANAVDDSLEVFWRWGYNAASMEQLVAATGLSRSSIYSEFESKRGLFDKALKRYLEVFFVRLEPLRTGGLESIISFLSDLKGSVFLNPEFGCLVVNVRPEFSSNDAGFGRMYIRYEESIASGFESALATADRLGELAESTDIQLRVSHLSLMLLGLFGYARGNPNTDATARRAEALVAEVENWRRRSFRQRRARSRPARDQPQ